MFRGRSRHFLGIARANFLLAGAESGSRLFKAAPALSFWQAIKESLSSCVKHDLRAIYKGKYDPIKDLN